MMLSVDLLDNILIYGAGASGVLLSTYFVDICLRSVDGIIVSDGHKNDDCLTTLGGNSIKIFEFGRLFYVNNGNLKIINTVVSAKDIIRRDVVSKFTNDSYMELTRANIEEISAKIVEWLMTLDYPELANVLSKADRLFDESGVIL